MHAGFDDRHDPHMQLGHAALAHSRQHDFHVRGKQVSGLASQVNSSQVKSSKVDSSHVMSSHVMCTLLNVHYALQLLLSHMLAISRSCTT